MLIVFFSFYIGKCRACSVKVPHGYFSTNVSIVFPSLLLLTTNYKSLEHQSLTLPTVKNLSALFQNFFFSPRSKLDMASSDQMGKEKLQSLARTLFKLRTRGHGLAMFSHSFFTPTSKTKIDAFLPTGRFNSLAFHKVPSSHCQLFRKQPAIKDVHVIWSLAVLLICHDLLRTSIV